MQFGLRFTLLLQFFLQARSIAEELSLTNDEGLVTFVTLPHLKAPKFNVRVYNDLQTASGYWFVAPYVSLAGGMQNAESEPCQIGPYIYDNQGHLVWSGACLSQNENSFDFKAINIETRTYLSFIHSNGHPDMWKGNISILNIAYEPELTFNISKQLNEVDMHEFSITSNLQSALVITSERIMRDLSDVGMPDIEAPILFNGFREIHVPSGEVLFDWSSAGYIPLNESSLRWENSFLEKGWDYLHFNSVDKDANGDYLVSARHADCIYKVSGRDGHIIWRLGGKASDFKLEGFNFSRQHDARFQESTPLHTTVSFLNNAADGTSQTANWSSGLIVKLATTAPMTASLTIRYDRPDKGLSISRGNMQKLPNNNIVISWGEEGYLSEFTEDGECVLEAGFESKQFSTYRGYKLDFAGYPAQPPLLKCFSVRRELTTPSTVCYVTWNGATGVVSWNFFTRNDTSLHATIIGRAEKIDFETVFVAEGHIKSIWAEALDIDGRILGKSSLSEAVFPSPLEAGSPFHNYEQMGQPKIKNPVKESSFLWGPFTLLWVCY